MITASKLEFSMPRASKSYCEMLGEQAQRRTYSETSVINISSPLPTPVFFKEKTFSSKKERSFMRIDRPPPTPKPNIESCGLFGKKNRRRPQSISFVNGVTPLSSRYYNEKCEVLYFNQCFDIICKLGSGSFGEVFKVRSKDDGDYYAVKRSKRQFHGQSDRRRKMEEVKKHERLPKHQNCVQFHKAWEEKERLYIQLELCDISLSQYSEENHDIPESTIWYYLIDLLLAVKHLHDHGFVHLDIKPENIFVSKNGICKLGDFGLMLDVAKSDITEAVEGDSKYLAPEIMHGVFTRAADIFSLGITILELACDLDLPQGDDAWHQLRQKQIPMDFLKNLSPELIGVIQSMMEPDPEIRPNVDSILNIETIHKVYEQRKHVLQMEDVQSTKSSHSSPQWDNSFSDSEVFLTGNNLFSSPANYSNGYLPKSPLITPDKNISDLLMEHEDSLQRFSCNSRLHMMSDESEKKISSGMLNPCRSSSPKLSRRILSFQDIDKDGEDDIPLMRPQKLLNLFDEQSSDTSF